ncbi:MAG: TetR/AcrR family transcriptional regulator [Deltaproteobacteria bacterium]|nr:TetR/AcrR family transcriptional regulator [Deltaproteobacteria bacterium]
MGRPAANTIAVATTERVLNAALQEFARRGFDGARLADVAAAAGITRPSLLYHFASKEQLYAATVAQAFGSISDMIVTAVSARGSFRDRLRFLVEGFLAFAAENPAVCRLLMRTVVADDDATTRALLLEQAAPLLDDVTRFFAHDGESDLQPGANLRAGLMSVVVNVLAKAASGPLRAPLWGGENDDDVWMIVEHGLLRSAPTTTTEASLSAGGES